MPYTHGAVLRPWRDRGFAQYPEQRGERVVDGAPVDSQPIHERHAVAFGERVGVVALPLGNPPGARAPIVWALRLLAARHACICRMRPADVCRPYNTNGGDLLRACRRYTKYGNQRSWGYLTPNPP